MLQLQLKTVIPQMLKGGSQEAYQQAWLPEDLAWNSHKPDPKNQSAQVSNLLSFTQQACTCYYFTTSWSQVGHVNVFCSLVQKGWHQRCCPRLPQELLLTNEVLCNMLGQDSSMPQNCPWMVTMYDGPPGVMF